MAVYLGVDTSNYTTSIAIYDREAGTVKQVKRLLPVREGAVGQRQSDAVFGHVKALGGLARGLMAGAHPQPAAIGVSATPTYAEGSYMPCFLVGEMAAETTAAVLGAPLYRFSHQAGHVAAAAFGAGRLDLLERPFLAFHVSGGTTDCVRVFPHGERILATEPVSRSLDLHAGQAVDRVGAMLGLPFPAGPALEQLAASSGKDFRPRPSMKGADCCLSGLENQCRNRLEAGENPADVARYCLCFLRETLIAMTRKALERFPGLPLLYGGGVMSNRFLQEAIGDTFAAAFAPPAYSADNGAGVAILCGLRHQREGTP